MASEEKVESHYVARVVIERVDKTPIKDGNSYNAVVVDHKREVTELANFLVKDDEIESLKGKVSNHVGLIEDFG
jgi:hypothetical protein